MKVIKQITAAFVLLLFSLSLVSCMKKEDFKKDFNNETAKLGVSGLADDVVLNAGENFSAEISEGVTLELKLNDKSIPSDIKLTSDSKDSKWIEYATALVNQYMEDTADSKILEVISASNDKERDGFMSTMKVSENTLARISIEDGVRTIQFIRNV